MMTPRQLNPAQSLPLVLERPAAMGAEPETLTAWIAGHRALIEEATHEAGAVLLRGFAIDSPEAFRTVAAAVRPELRNYVGGDSPRRVLADKVYSSTEYSAELEVLLHNELSYAGWSPERVFFGCLKAAERGGETHIADGRAVYRRLDPEIRRNFEERGVTYLQRLWDAAGKKGPGKSWQETFETKDSAQVEGHLAEAGMSWDWTARGLETAARRPAVRQHPVTDALCWHNQADQWHRGLPSVKDSVGTAPGASNEEDWGNHVTYGDGGEIAVDDLLRIRKTLGACEALFPWREGDVLVIDNVLALHGRKPFAGPRRILVAMA